MIGERAYCSPGFECDNCETLRKWNNIPPCSQTRIKALNYLLDKPTDEIMANHREDYLELTLELDKFGLSIDDLPSEMH